MDLSAEVVEEETHKEWIEKSKKMKKMKKLDENYFEISILLIAAFDRTINSMSV